MKLPLERRVSAMEIVLIVTDLFILFVVLMAVGILSLYQFYFVATNTTTIESWEKDRVSTLVRRKKLKPVLRGVASELMHSSDTNA